MKYISERIVNLSDYEKKISDTTLHSEHLMTMFKNNEFKESVVVAQFINKNLKELTDFEFIIEHRKVSNKNREGEITMEKTAKIILSILKENEIDLKVGSDGYIGLVKGEEKFCINDLAKEHQVKISSVYQPYELLRQQMDLLAKKSKEADVETLSSLSSAMVEIYSRI